MYLVFTRTPGEIYHRRLRSLLLYLCYVLWVQINSLVGWFCKSALGLVLFQIHFFCTNPLSTIYLLCWEYLTQVFMWACEIKLVILLVASLCTKLSLVQWIQDYLSSNKLISDLVFFCRAVVCSDELASNVFDKLIVVKLKMEIDIMFTIDYFVQFDLTWIHSLRLYCTMKHSNKKQNRHTWSQSKFTFYLIEP